MIYQLLVFVLTFSAALNAECPCKKASKPSKLALADELQAAISCAKKDSEHFERLKLAFPQYGIEEWDKEYVWVVRNDDECIQVGLAQGGRAVLGVCYFPKSEVLYWAVKGQGVYRQGKGSSAQRLWVPMATRLVSPSVLDFKENAGAKICRIIEDAYNIYFSRVGDDPRDFLAGEVLLTEAGGIMTDFQGLAIDYRSNTTPGIIASNNHLLHQRYLP